MSRDVAFLLADSAMQQLLEGFFGRAQFHRSLSCGWFDFDRRADVVVAPTKDPGVYGTARELLRPYEHSHHHAVVMLDAAWDGSPGAEKIHKQITEALTGVWADFAVIVLDPEIEVWLWQRNANVDRALKHRGDAPAWELLERHGHWPAEQPKPPGPKEAKEFLRRSYRADISNAVFRRAAAAMSVRYCVDPAFIELRDALARWFPEGR